jgi:acyl-CoA thioester hydrolase
MIDIDLRAEVEMQVPFYDTDPMAIVWHGNYTKYFELGRCALLDKINFGYREMDQSGYIWPVVDLRLQYVKSAVLGQRIRITAVLKEYENRLKIDYSVTDAAAGTRLCKGYSVQVAVDRATGEMCFVSPRILLERLGLTG